MKKLIALILCLLLVGGCARPEPPEPSPQPSPSQEKPSAQPSAAPTPREEPSPEPKEAYVIANGPTDWMIGLSRLNEGNRVRLAGKLAKARDGHPLTVAYIGGSITQGSSAGATDCYARLVTDWFETAYPDSEIVYINAGIGATGSYIGVHRADGDVLAYEPDIVFVEFSVNDTSERTERNVNAYDSLLQKLWSAPSEPAVVCIAMTQENGTSFQQKHAEIALFYDLPFLSYKDAILGVIKEGYIKWTDISDDNIHPNVTGHKVLSQLIIAYLEDVDQSPGLTGGAESDFYQPYTVDLYRNARLIKPGDQSVTSLGAFEDNTASFGGFSGSWRASGEEMDDNASLVFEVEAMNIAVLFGKLTKKGGLYEIIIDGETVKTIDARFPNGWGNYVEVEEVASFGMFGRHTVEIRPVAAEGDTSFILSALAVS